MPININMRCIEIPMHLRHDGQTYSININMRCIEIHCCGSGDANVTRLTLT